MANDSLEDEILALVGEGSESPLPSLLQDDADDEGRGANARGGKSRPKRSSPTAASNHSKQKKKPLKDEDSESEYEGRGAPTRRRSRGSSRAARKEDTAGNTKASTSTDTDGEDGPFNEVDGYDEQFRGDAKDQAWLAQLSEVERERVIAERAERRQRLLEHREIQSRLGADTGDEDYRRTRNAGASRKAESISNKDKSDSLRELKRRREDKGARKVARGDSSRDGTPHGKRRTSESASGSHSDEPREGVRRLEDNNEEKKYAAPPVPLADFVNLYVRRTELARWVHAPYFEQGVIGAFVRVSSLEGIYRIARVKDVVPHSKAYPLEQTVTDKALLLTYGSDERAFSMHWLSDSPIQLTEYERYVGRATEDKGVIPTRQYYDEKMKDLNYARNYVLNEAEVSEMIRKRKKFDEGTVNVKEEIARLAHLRGSALLNGDMEEFERLGREFEKFSRLYKKDEPGLYV